MIFRDADNEIAAEVIKIDEGYFMVRLTHTCNDETYAYAYFNNEVDAIQYCKDYCGIECNAA